VTGKASGTKPVVIAAFDVRGGEPVEVELGSQWVVEAENSGALFKDVDLTADWADYDEDGSQPISIMSVDASFAKK